MAKMRTFASLGLLALLALVLLLRPPPGTAQIGGGYDLTWNTFDGGGGTFSTGGGYSLGATAGQPDARILAGRGYTLGGGFWKGGSLSRQAYNIYLPLVTSGFQFAGQKEGFR
jgi:hypothetical protein